MKYLLFLFVLWALFGQCQGQNDHSAERQAALSKNADKDYYKTPSNLGMAHSEINTQVDTFHHKSTGVKIFTKGKDTLNLYFKFPFEIDTIRSFFVEGDRCLIEASCCRQTNIGSMYIVAFELSNSNWKYICHEVYSTYFPYVAVMIRSSTYKSTIIDPNHFQLIVSSFDVQGSRGNRKTEKIDYFLDYPSKSFRRTKEVISDK